MRKLLILLLVVGFASYAFAGATSFIILVNGTESSEVANGDTVTVQWNDASVAFGDTGPADIKINVSAGSYVADSFWWNQDAPLWAAVGIDGWSTDPAFTVTPSGDGFDAVVTGIYEWQNNMLGPPTSGVEFSFQFTAGDPDIVIDTTAGSYSDDTSFASEGADDGFPYAVLTPEPMTIVMLGLGGLFLVRRK